MSDRTAASCVARVALQIASEAAPLWGKTPQYVLRAYHDRPHREDVERVSFKRSDNGETEEHRRAALSTNLAVRAVADVRFGIIDYAANVRWSVHAARHAVLAAVPKYGYEQQKLAYDYGSRFRSCPGALFLLDDSGEYRTGMRDKPERKRSRQRKVES